EVLEQAHGTDLPRLQLGDHAELLAELLLLLLDAGHVRVRSLDRDQLLGDPPLLALGGGDPRVLPGVGDDEPEGGHGEHEHAERPGMRAGPPDRKTAPSGSSVAAVQKKLSARWISSTMSSVTEPRICSAAAGSAPPAARPCFSASASAGDTPSWRTSASLYSA